MQERKNNPQAYKKSPVIHGAFLALPFVLIFALFILAWLWGWQLFRGEYPAFSLLVRPQHQAVFPQSTPTTHPDPPQQEQQSFYPIVAIGEQWGVMQVEGWQQTDIPLIFGDEKSLLKLGAGTWPGSRLCGQDGKLVFCAHVTTWFYELEDTEVGDRVSIETYYGNYVYEVTETKVFHKDDHSVLKNTDGEETLVLYTCYPRSVGFRYTDQRYAVICKLVEGKTWIER